MQAAWYLWAVKLAAGSQWAAVHEWPSGSLSPKLVTAAGSQWAAVDERHSGPWSPMPFAVAGSRWFAGWAPFSPQLSLVLLHSEKPFPMAIFASCILFDNTNALSPDSEARLHPSYSMSWLIISNCRIHGKLMSYTWAGYVCTLCEDTEGLHMKYTVYMRGHDWTYGSVNIYTAACQMYNYVDTCLSYGLRSTLYIF